MTSRKRTCAPGIHIPLVLKSTHDVACRPTSSPSPPASSRAPKASSYSASGCTSSVCAARSQLFRNKAALRREDGARSACANRSSRRKGEARDRDQPVPLASQLCGVQPSCQETGFVVAARLCTAAVQGAARATDVIVFVLEGLTLNHDVPATCFMQPRSDSDAVCAPCTAAMMLAGAKRMFRSLAMVVGESEHKRSAHRSPKRILDLALELGQANTVQCNQLVAQPRWREERDRPDPNPAKRASVPAGITLDRPDGCSRQGTQLSSGSVGERSCSCRGETRKA